MSAEHSQNPKVENPQGAPVARDHTHTSSGISSEYCIRMEKNIQKDIGRLEALQNSQPLDLNGIVKLRLKIGGDYKNLGNTQESLKYFEQALEISKKILPPGHQNLAGAYHDIGEAYFQLGNYQKAIEYLETALEIKKHIFQKAIEYLETALEIKKHILPSNHLAPLYNNIGGAYLQLGNYQKALEYLEPALEIHQKTSPTNHPDLAGTFCNISSYYHYIGNQTKALEYYTQAADIMKNPCPADGVNIDDISTKLAKLKSKIDTETQKAACTASAAAVSSSTGESAGDDPPATQEDVSMKDTALNQATTDVSAMHAQAAASEPVDKGLSEQTIVDAATEEDDVTMSIEQDKPVEPTETAATAEDSAIKDAALQMPEIRKAKYLDRGYAMIQEDLDYVRKSLKFAEYAPSTPLDLPYDIPESTKIFSKLETLRKKALDVEKTIPEGILLDDAKAYIKHLISDIEGFIEFFYNVRISNSEIGEARISDHAEIIGNVGDA